MKIKLLKRIRKRFSYYKAAEESFVLLDKKTSTLFIFNENNWGKSHMYYSGNINKWITKADLKNKEELIFNIFKVHIYEAFNIKRHLYLFNRCKRIEKYKTL